MSKQWGHGFHTGRERGQEEGFWNGFGKGEQSGQATGEYLLAERLRVILVAMEAAHRKEGRDFYVLYEVAKSIINEHINPDEHDWTLLDELQRKKLAEWAKWRKDHQVEEKMNDPR